MREALTDCWIELFQKRNRSGFSQKQTARIFKERAASEMLCGAADGITNIDMMIEWQRLAQATVSKPERFTAGPSGK